MPINTKRIAKNTIFLYMRLILVMGVTLYAARVVLEVLGETDYGLYYAVFSVIGLLSFLNGTLSIGTARFITFELGTGKTENLKITFSTTLFAHGVLAAIIVLLGETVGVWYVHHTLVVPPERFLAALTVYHISIISTVVSILQVPFTAEIIAHERMSVYAYIGIFEAVSRLVVVYLLLNTGFDKLEYYAWLQFIVVTLVFIINVCYCITSFVEATVKIRFNKSIFKSIIKFSGWNIIANISETLMSQGVVMMYNYFFLPVVVAAQAITNQISNALAQLVGNVRQAVNPQIIKLYAENQYVESQRLTLISAECIFFLLLLLGVPCIAIMPSLLSIWLIEVPDFTVAFSRLIILQQILGSFSAAYYAPLLAANKVIKNSIASVVLCIFQFIILWWLFYKGFGPLWARYLGLVSATVFSFVIKPYILFVDINYNLRELYKSIFHCLLVLLEVALVCGLIYLIIPQLSLMNCIIVLITMLLAITILVYMNLNKSVKKRINKVILNKKKSIW